MNSNKTQAIWLGCNKGSQRKYIQDLKMEWNPSKFKILGIWLTADLVGCETINYDEKFYEMRTLFRIWVKRQITPLGRIAILKSLILSKMVHLWLLLPNPPEKFTNGLQKFIFQFVWKKKQDRINRITVIKNIRNGGLGVVDIKYFANSLKLTWLRKFKETKHAWKNIVSKEIPNILMIDKLGPFLDERANSTNKFWKDVFAAYQLLHKNLLPSKPEEFLAEPIWHNKNIKISRDFVPFRAMRRKDVYKISHFVNENGNFYTLDQFNITHALNVNFIAYNHCINAIKNFLVMNSVTLSNNVASAHCKSLSTIYANKKGTKNIYNAFVGKTPLPKCCDKWDAKMGKSINWTATFFKIQKIQEIKLKWLQIRIVHRIIGTNKYLKLMKIKNND